MDKEKIYYYKDKDCLFFFIDNKRLDCVEKMSFLIENNIPHKNNDMVMTYINNDESGRFINLIEYFKYIFENELKIKVGKKKHIYYDNEYRRHNNTSLNRNYFNFVSKRMCDRIIKDYWNEIEYEKSDNIINEN